MAKNKETETALAIAEQNTALAVLDMSEDAGAGRENVRMTDLARAFMNILQAGSPQVRRGDAKRIDGAVAGGMFNNVTNEIYDGEKGITGVVVAFEKKMVQWIPRGAGGGFVAAHDPGSDLEKTAKIVEVTDENGKIRKILQLPNGDSLVETAYYYFLHLSHESGIPELLTIAMKGTDLGVSRKFNSVWTKQLGTRPDGSKYQLPIFGQIYHFTIVLNQKYDVYNWNPVFVEQVSNTQLYKLAKGLAAKVGSGEIKAQEQAPDAGEGGEGKDVPF